MISLLHDETRNLDICKYASWTQTSTPTLITNSALDGTTYVQIVGDPVIEYDVTAYVTRSERYRLDEAAANGSLLSCTTSKGKIYGRICEQIKYGDRLAGDYYKATLTLNREA